MSAVEALQKEIERINAQISSLQTTRDGLSRAIDIIRKSQPNTNWPPQNSLLLQPLAKTADAPSGFSKIRKFIEESPKGLTFPEIWARCQQEGITSTRGTISSQLSRAVKSHQLDKEGGRFSIPLI